MSILSALKQHNSSIDDLAALPQAMIMQMAQKKQISEEMLAPILARKAEMADAFARQNSLKNAGQMPPTVMEQLMAQNAQAEQPQIPQQMQQSMPQQMSPQMPQQMQQEMPQEMGVSQLPIPERQYAGGGIIAFADGGMSDEDEDYEDSLEEADYNAMIERAMNAGEDDYASTFETQHAKGSPQSFPNSSRDSDSDIDARLRSIIMSKESGGKRYDKNGNLLTSHKGAQGEMQVMPATARDPGFGIKPAKSDNPDELRRVGDEYASVLLRRYRDPKLAMIAYNMGPGATDKWLASGADPRRLPRETQGYISGVNLAGGGEVKHFQYGGSTMGGFEDIYTDIGVPLRPEIDEYTIDPMTGQKIFSGYRGEQSQKTKQTESSKASPTTEIPQAGLTADEMIAGSTRAGTFEAMMKDQTTGLPIVPVAKTAAPKSRLDAYMDKLIARESAMEKQRDDDKNIALLTAGLGMLGGTSQYAFENIGKGALAGVQQYGESKKQRGAEQAALDKSMLYANRYQGAEDVARQNAAFNQEHKGQALKETARANTNKEIEHAQSNFNQYVKTQQDALKARFPAGEMDPGYQAAMAAIAKSAPYKTLAQRAGYNLEEQRSTFTPKQEALLNKYK